MTPKFKSKLPSKEDFKQYVLVQLSGVTNMFDIRKVEELTGLSSEKIIYIMEHYKELEDKYTIKLKQ